MLKFLSFLDYLKHLLLGFILHHLTHTKKESKNWGWDCSKDMEGDKNGGTTPPWLRQELEGSSGGEKWSCTCLRNPDTCLIHVASPQLQWNITNQSSEMGSMKADVLLHPLYEQLLGAHVACLRIATPVHALHRIDTQLQASSQQIYERYSHLASPSFRQSDQGKEELDQFMTHYVLLLCSFKEHLQQHVRGHAMEAVTACWELEQSFSALTGVSPGDGNDDTMSDEEDEETGGFYEVGFDAHENGGFGPLIPTENERSLMERVRHELKAELKQGYKNKLIDVRDEILRKRRAGKLPGDTTNILKAWWEAHSKWPYPTEDEKNWLVQETGLQLKQINNWFINQRKRNWHNNQSVPSKTKRKW